MRRVRHALAFTAVIGALAWLETRWPLRARTRPRGPRSAVNLAVAASTAAIVGPIQRALVGRATAVVERRNIGLTRWVNTQPLVQRIAGFVALDYTLWHWHRLCHRMPMLWRMHAIHHADLDLDWSTALRFGLGELLASVPVRAAQVLLLGIDRATLRTWETALLIAILFHHSNWRLPARVDAGLSWLAVTPRLHGIHHSVRPRALETNFGTLLTLWDVIHGSRRTDVRQDAIVLGLPDRA